MVEGVSSSYVVFMLICAMVFVKYGTHKPHRREIPNTDPIVPIEAWVVTVRVIILYILNSVYGGCFESVI